VPVSRVVEVSPDRLARWAAGFAARHGRYDVEISDDAAALRASDGTVAVLTPPFPPAPVTDGGPALEALARHAQLPRRVGLLLVRLGGYAAGVFDNGELVASKVGSRPVHGRIAAGGWSQQRFARRREGQARVALAAAADAAAAVLLPAVDTLDAVVTGGDRKALRDVLGDPRLRSLSRVLVRRVLDVPDPKAAVLRAAYASAIAIRVAITEP
jgi:peptide subunit release factor 1 (eRF1)